MAVGKLFDRFITSLEPTDAELDKAGRSYANVCGILSRNIWKSGDYSAYSFLTGSYGKNTAIRHTKNVDVMFVLPYSWYSKYCKVWYERQYMLLKAVSETLRPANDRTAVRDFHPVVDVRVGGFTVEVVPCFGMKNGNYLICDTANGGSWKEDSPQAQLTNVIASNTRTNGNTSRLIKMLKSWKRTHDVPIKSLALELLAVNFLDVYPSGAQQSPQYDLIVRDFFGCMVARANQSLIVPGTSERIALGDLWSSCAQTALRYSVTACEYEITKEKQVIAKEWLKVFGDAFLGTQNRTR